MIKTGTKVEWEWGDGSGDSPREPHPGDQGNGGYSQNGSEGDPAYVIEQSDGATVLRLRSEVSEAG